MYESYSHVDGIPFNYISYGTATQFTVDLIDSCVATMNPELIVYAKEKSKFKHNRKQYYPFQEDIGTSCYGEYFIDEERSVPKVVEYFIRMQRLHVNWKIPKEIKLFIEKFEALSLLES